LVFPVPNNFMASPFLLLVDRTPVEGAFYDKNISLEVEENADLPGAIQIMLPVSRTNEGDLTQVNSDLFKPLSNLALVVGVEGRRDECIFDGYVLTHKLHLETGETGSNLTVWGQDASWLMNLEEKTREWVDISDASVANTIFKSYGIDTAAGNTEDDSPAHTEDGYTLMQRASDIQFLRNLARRNGKLCRVACTSKPGKRTGYFAKPKLDGNPVVTLKPNESETWNVRALDFSWDVSRPNTVKASQALFNDTNPDGVSADLQDSGLKLLGDRSLLDFAGKPMTVLLTAPVDSAGELRLRAQSLLRESGWFVRCEGEADVSRLKTILRVNTIVQIEGVGSLNSGKYYVWSVRHTITADAHKMKFVLVRNAVGAASSGSGGLLGGLL
jgi:phage protein D